MLSIRRTRPVRVAKLTASHHRTRETDRVLGVILAAIAGSLNAGGFILLSDYTSHMTGHLSQISGGMVVRNVIVIVDSLSAVACFTLGAALSAALIAWGQANRLRICYALPLGIQGAMLACIPFIEELPREYMSRVGLCTVSFVMGLQNATITRISGARIRTSHATGLITDMGIEIGRSMYRMCAPASGVKSDGSRLWLYVQLVVAFIVGGIAGAVGHGMIGWDFAAPPGALLIIIALWR